MKRIFLLLLILLTFGVNIFPDIVKNIADDYQFTLTYHSLGTHQAGETIPLSIKRTSDNYWYDFNDSSFKNSGWTSKTVNLTEDSTNHNYYYTWASQGGDTTVNTYVFHVELADAFIEEESIAYQDLIDASDNIGINWADVSNPTTTVGLSNTTILKLTELDEDNTTIDLDGSTILKVKEFDEDNTTIDIDGTTIGTVTTATTATTVTNVSDKTGYTLTTADKNTLIDLVWDEANSGHLGVGTTGLNLNNVGSYSDPWSVELPGIYTGIQAGQLIATVKDSTDGDTETGVYTGIENTIRNNR